MPVTALKPYVEFKNRGYWIVGTRVALDSVVYAFQQGKTPTEIVRSYPLLSLENVYGAIAFYLANRDDIDAYLASEEKTFNTMPQPLLSDAPDLYKKLVAAKASLERT